MAVKKLLRMGDQRLTKKAAAVHNIGDPQIQAAIDDLIDSMHHYGGVGIAGPQIGHFKRIVVMEVVNNPRYPDAYSLPLTVLINPEIKILTDERENGWEGCLCVPGYRGQVPRFTHLRYRGVDRDVRPVEAEVRGFHARVVQHEVDHLDGILYPMRIEDMSQFGCEDILWEQMNDAPYPAELKQKIREQWNL